jgi:hypothetical protein
MKHVVAAAVLAAALAACTTTDQRIAGAAAGAGTGALFAGPIGAVADCDRRRPSSAGQLTRFPPSFPSVPVQVCRTLRQSVAA